MLLYPENSHSTHPSAPERGQRNHSAPDFPPVLAGHLGRVGSLLGSTSGGPSRSLRRRNPACWWRCRCRRFLQGYWRDPGRRSLALDNHGEAQALALYNHVCRARLSLSLSPPPFLFFGYRRSGKIGRRDDVLSAMNLQHLFSLSTSGTTRKHALDSIGHAKSQRHSQQQDMQVFCTVSTRERWCTWRSSIYRSLRLKNSCRDS